MAKKDTALETPTVLAFERKLDPSDALMYAVSWDQRNDVSAQPAAVREKAVRGTASHRLKAKEEKDALKQNMKVESPNPQIVDVATLPHNVDTLKTQFTLRVLGGAGVPSACNNAEYQDKLKTVVDGYVEQSGFAELARRYAYNLANGRFLWRNRVGAEEVEVQIRKLEKGNAANTWTFDALALSLRDFSSNGADEELGELADSINRGLSGEGLVLLEVTAYARVGAGQEVFPSQELILDRGRGDKSKTLYKVEEVAGIHSQKLGNAIRTVDTWYPQEAEDDLGPIAVEPYGSVTTQGKAYRQPKDKQDFYNLLDDWLLKDQVPETEQQHFVMATLIRGGVFGKAG